MNRCISWHFTVCLSVKYYFSLVILIYVTVLYVPQVIGAASGEKLEVVRNLGASETIDYHKESIKDKVSFNLAFLRAA